METKTSTFSMLTTPRPWTTTSTTSSITRTTPPRVNEDEEVSRGDGGIDIDNQMTTSTVTASTTLRPGTTTSTTSSITRTTTPSRVNEDEKVSSGDGGIDDDDQDQDRKKTNTKHGVNNDVDDDQDRKKMDAKPDVINDVDDDQDRDRKKTDAKSDANDAGSTRQEGNGKRTNVTISYEGDYETVDDHLRKQNRTARPTHPADNPPSNPPPRAVPDICEGNFDAVSLMRNELFLFKGQVLNSFLVRNTISLMHHCRHILLLVCLASTGQETAGRISSAHSLSVS